MTHRLTTSALALSAACIAAPALADVTAADVWENQQALYSGMGVALNGTLSGEELTGAGMNIILPQGIASMQITTDATITMAENGDGTVTVSYPSPMGINISGGAQGEGSFSVDLTLTHGGYTITAAGDPNDVSYTSAASDLELTMSALSLDGEEAGDLSGSFIIDGWTGTSQVTVGNLVTYEATSLVGETVADFEYTLDNVTSTTNQTSSPVETNVSLALPIGGSDLMNLSAATRNGLSVTLNSTGSGSDSTTETTLDGELLNRQVTSTGPQVLAMTFSDEGLMLSGSAEGFDLTMNDQMLFPGDIEFSTDAVTMTYDVPLNASEEPQDFRLATSIQGLTLGDMIWNLFDPAGQLPRDPAEITFDITGVGTNGMDLLDFEALSQMFGPPPIQVDEVTIENLVISAVGAEAMAQGAMTFDWTDFETIPGVPRPEGQVTVNLNGINQLLDTLAQMGLIPEEELMMPRMMLGMFATPVGDDMLETVLEVNEQGHVLANGQRLQ